MGPAGLFRFVMHVCWSVALGSCLSAPAGAQEHEPERVVTLSVVVDPVKVNGSPWDGYPAVGGRIIIPGSSNKPDIAVCVVLPAGAPVCIWRTEDRRTHSHCPDAESCTIPGIRVPSLPIGLIFMDVDLVRHDLIDFVILTGKTAEPGELQKLEANMRTVMANLTPGATPRDRAHRQRKARVLPLDLCIGESKKCDLSQSRFWLEE